MTAQLSPTPTFKGWANNGTPLAYGLLYSYAAGTTTPQATYTDSTQGTPNTNPVVLNARGECALWLDPTKSYKFNLTDSNGNQISGYPVDNIQGQLGPSGSVIPTVNNAFDLGSPSFEWRNIYAGTQVYIGTTPVLNIATGNIGYYAQTAAEISAGVTPTNYAYQAGDLRRYGADPTGVSDSTTAITNALNSNTVVFDSYGGGGTYLFTNISIPDGVTLKGQGQEKTIFKTSTATQAITLATNADFIHLENFKLLQTGSVQGYGIAGINNYWITTRKVWVNGFQYNLYMSFAIYHSHYDSRFDNGQYGVYYYGASGNWNTAWFNNDIVFVNCRAGPNTVQSWYLKTVNATLLSCDMGGTGAGITITGDSTPSIAFGNVIINPYSEGVTTTAFNFAWAKVNIMGGFTQGGGVGTPTTTMVRADQSSDVMVDNLGGFSYFTNRFWATNSSAITYRRVPPAVAGSSDTTDATSAIYNIAGENSGSFTGTLTGCTTSPTGTITWDRNGNLVTLYIPSISGTSNATTCTVTGLPAAITPVTNQPFIGPVTNNGTNSFGYCNVNLTGIIALTIDANSTAFTNAGAKAIVAQTITYKLN
jgi:hypothetical protein